MEKLIQLIAKVLVALLILIASIYIIITWAKGDASIKEDPSAQNYVLNPFFYNAYVAFFVAAISAVLFPIVYMIMNPKNAVRALVGVGILLVIAGIAYAMADGSTTGAVYEKYQISSAQSKNVGMGLYLTYILGFLTIGTLLYSEVVKFFK